VNFLVHILVQLALVATQMPALFVMPVSPTILPLKVACLIFLATHISTALYVPSVASSSLYLAMVINLATCAKLAVKYRNVLVATAQMSQNVSVAYQVII